MKQIHLTIGVRFEGECTDKQFEGFLLEIFNQLDNIGREVVLSLTVPDRVAHFATIVDADDFVDAANHLLVDFRTALHAAGHSTPAWPKLIPTEHTVRELQDA